MVWANAYLQGDDLASVADDHLHHQVFYAIAERQKILASATWCKLPPAGCLPFQVSDVAPPQASTWPPPEGLATDVFSLRWAQQWIEDNCTSFVRDSAVGAYDAKAEVETFTLETLRSDAGIDPLGFLRHVPDGAGGFVVDYGPFTIGDYVCPHLWNELVACLKLLCSTSRTLAWTQRDPPIDGRYGEAFRASLALARSAAAGLFDADAIGGVTAAIPRANVSEHRYAANNFFAAMVRTRVKGQVTLPSSVHNAAIDMYAMPTTPVTTTFYEFNGNSDFDGYQNLLKAVEVDRAYVAGQAVAVVGDNYVGPSANSVRPAWPAATLTADGQTSWCGYWVFVQTAVVRYGAGLRYGDS